MMVIATTAQPAMLVKKQLSSNMAVSFNKISISTLLDARSTPMFTIFAFFKE